MLVKCIRFYYGTCMPNYIEFTTDHHEDTHGSPVHDGRLPRRFHDIDAVRMNGEPVAFKDESIPERLQRYFAEANKLKRRRIANDCVTFVALMNSIKLENRGHNPFSDFDRETAVDTSATAPLVLVQGFHGGLKIPQHIILPAHMQDQENYLHKLGDRGPLCMSDLDTAMRIMNCTSAHPVSVE